MIGLKSIKFLGQPKLVAWVVAFLLLASNNLNAQKIEIGGGIGAFKYQGDLSPLLNYFQLRDIKPGYQFLVRNYMGKAVNMKYALTYAQLSGTYASTNNIYFNNLQRNSFSTNIYEFATSLEYNFFNYRAERYRRMSPYFYGGLGVFMYDPPASPEGGSSSIQMMIPFGFGVKYILRKQWNLGIEVGTRKLYTDLLDGVSDVNGAGLQRGEKHDNDWYFHTMFHVTYTIYTIPCPFDFY